MAGPGAKGGMWSRKSNGQRVLVTKSMARQMAAAGMSAETDAQYADQAAKLREQNNAEAKAKRKADVEKRTIRGEENLKYNDSKPQYFLIDNSTISGVSPGKVSDREVDDFLQAGFSRTLPIIQKDGFDTYSAIDKNDRTLQIGKKAEQKDPRNGEMINAMVLDKSNTSRKEIQYLREQQKILKQIDALRKPDIQVSKATFNKKSSQTRKGYFLEDVSSMTNNKSAKFSRKEEVLINKMANSMLKTGVNLRTIPVVRTGFDTVKALGNPLIIEAARRAEKKDPKRGEMTSVQYINSKAQYEAYKRQGKRKG